MVVTTCIAAAVEHGSSNRISQVASILIGSAVFAALTHVTNTHKQRERKTMLRSRDTREQPTSSTAWSADDAV